MIESTAAGVRETLLTLTMEGACYAMQEANQIALFARLERQLSQAATIARAARISAIRLVPGCVGMCAADAWSLFGQRSLPSQHREALVAWYLAEHLLTEYLLARFTVELPGPRLAKLYDITVKAR